MMMKTTRKKIKIFKQNSILKRLLSLAMCFLMIFGIPPSAVFAAEATLETLSFEDIADRVVSREAPPIAADNTAPSEDELWKAYLNERFYNAVRGSKGAWSAKWYASEADVPKWSGFEAGSDDAVSAGGSTTSLGESDIPTNTAGFCTVPYSSVVSEDPLTPDVKTTTYYVWSGEQLLYALKHCAASDANAKSVIEIMGDIDLNGQGGKRWSGIDLGTHTVTINGNDHTVYNLCAVGSGSVSPQTYASLISYVRGDFIMQDIAFRNANLCDVSENGEGSYSHGVGIISWLNSPIARIENVDIFDSLFVGHYYVGGIFGRMDGSGDNTSFTKSIANCSSENNISFGDAHVGSLTGSVVYVNTIEYCYSIGSAVISTGGHSGGLFSCLGKVRLVQNCFVDAEVYGNYATGVFTGAVGGDGNANPSHIISCFSSGFVEGKQNLGGFVGITNYCSKYYDCYSTALVGLRSNGTGLGGFVGNAYSNEDGLTYGASPLISFFNCYAAGEVGSTDTNVGDVNTNGYTSNATTEPPRITAGAIGGFAGFIRSNSTAATIFESCYYDKQSTAMREWGIGNANTWAGLTGVLSTDTVKSGIGLMSAPVSTGNGFTDLNGDPSDNDRTCYNSNPSFSSYYVGTYPAVEARWNFSATDHYPELVSFKGATADIWGDERTAALVRAYSLSSTAGPLLETWDKEVDTTTGKLTKQSELPATYDTTRDIVSGFLLTSIAINKWNRIGTADSKETDGMTSMIAGTSYPVLDLKYQNGQYLCDELTCGIEWLKVSVDATYTDEATGEEKTVTATRRMRVIPTCAVDAGESAVITGNLYDHADDVKLMFSTAKRMAGEAALDGDSYDVTVGIFPDRSDIAAVFPLENANELTEQQKTLMGHGRAALSTEAAINTFFATGNDGFSGVSADFMQKDQTVNDNTNESLLYTYLYEVVKIEDDGEITTGSSPIVLNTENGNGIIENATYAQELNGYTPLPNADKQYLITYVWKLADGRSLMDAKLVRTAAVPFNVDIAVYQDSIADENLYTDHVSTYAGENTDVDSLTVSNSASATASIEAYTEASAAWKPVNPDDTLKSIKMTLNYSGSKYEKTIFDPEVGDEIAVNFKIYRIVYRTTGYYTIEEHVNRVYTLMQTDDGTYYLLFDKDGTAATLSADDIDTGRTVKLDDVENDIRVDVVYAPAPSAAEVAVSATKTLSGGGKTTADIKANQFGFTVTPNENNPAGGVTGLPAAAVYAAKTTGAVDFGTWTFGKVGSYSFTVSENAVTAGYTKADDVTVSVEVTLNETTNELEAQVTYSSGDTLAFANTYTAPSAAEVAVSATKTLSGGGKTTADIKANQFGFTVTPNEDNPAGGVTGLPAAAVYAAKTTGAVDFGTWTFGKVGSYSFSIKENDLGIPGFTYDKTVYQVEVEVTLNSTTNELEAEKTIIALGATETANRTVTAVTFANVYTEADNPKTGDDFKMLFYSSTVIFSAIGLCVSKVYRKKKHRRK